MSFPTYPEYKESKVEWLPNRPIHWGEQSLKRVVIEPLKYGANEAAENADPDHPRFVRITDVTSGGDLRIETYRSLPPEIASPYLLKVGDILLARSGATVGKSFIYQKSWGQCCFAGYLIRARIDKEKAVPKFIYLVLQSQNYWQYIGQEQIQSTIQNVSAERYEKFVIPIPTIHEQNQIARFLDHETAKIDALVREQEHLIALLQEKRQTVISHAVTKGLDRSVSMKDSRVEWLGEVPAHWEAVRMRFLCRITTGDKDTQDAEPNGEFPFFVRSENIERSDTYSFDGEGVFTSGDGAGVGKIFHHFKGQCAIHQRVYLFHEFSQVSGQFFFHYIKSKLEPVVLAQSAKSTVDSLRLPMLQNFWMTCPPRAEQAKICEYIEKFDAEATKLLQEAGTSITLLKERRSALISAAVTGKIDVRNWQPPTDESAFPDDVRQAGLEAEA